MVITLCFFTSRLFIMGEENIYIYRQRPKLLNNYLGNFHRELSFSDGLDGPPEHVLERFFKTCYICFWAVEVIHFEQLPSNLYTNFFCNPLENFLAKESNNINEDFYVNKTFSLFNTVKLIISKYVLSPFVFSSSFISIVVKKNVFVCLRTFHVCFVRYHSLIQICTKFR